MSVLLLPKKITDKLNALIRNYWRKGDPFDKGINWLSWDKMSLPKGEGGMGLRNFRAFNLGWQSWRLFVIPNTYWARFLEGIYFPNSSFLKASIGKRAYWAWSSIIQGTEISEAGLKMAGV